MKVSAALPCMVCFLLVPSRQAAKVKGIQMHVRSEEPIKQDRTMRSKSIIGSKSIIVQRDSVQEPFNTLIEELGKIMNQSEHQTSEGLIEESTGGSLGALRSDLHKRLGNKWRPSTVCQLGITAGDSTSIFRAHANMSVYEFDHGFHGYAKRAEAAVTADSLDACDVMIVNGTNSDDVVTADIQYMTRMALNHHVLILEKSACDGPTHAWNAMLTQGCLAELSVNKNESYCGYRVGVLLPCIELDSIAGTIRSWWHRLGYTKEKRLRTFHQLSIAGAVVGGLVASGWIVFLISRLSAHVANKKDQLKKQQKGRRNDQLVFQ